MTWFVYFLALNICFLSQHVLMLFYAYSWLVNVVIIWSLLYKFELKSALESPKVAMKHDLPYRLGQVVELRPRTPWPAALPFWATQRCDWSYSLGDCVLTCVQFDTLNSMLSSTGTLQHPVCTQLISCTYWDNGTSISWTMAESAGKHLEQNDTVLVDSTPGYPCI